MPFVTVFRRVPPPIVGTVGVIHDRGFEAFEERLDWLEAVGFPVESARSACKRAWWPRSLRAWSKRALAAVSAGTPSSAAASTPSSAAAAPAT